MDETAAPETTPTNSPREPPKSAFVGQITRTAIGAAVVIAIFAVFLFALGELHIVDLGWMGTHWVTGLSPFATSLILTVVAFVLGFAGAMPLGLIRASWRPGRARGPRSNPALVPAYGVTSGYVAAIRGTPFFVQTILLYFAMLVVAPRLELFGWDTPYWTGLLVLFVNTLGYQAEVFRAGFQTVAQGQVEAARAIGLTGTQIFFSIRLPQALRLILLPLTNEFIALFKASSILSIIAIYELFHWSEDLGQKFGHPIEGFVLVSIFYLAINIPLSRTVTFIEKWKRIPGLGTALPEAKSRLAAVWSRSSF